MAAFDYLKRLKKCELCEHRCGVNRLNGETGVCKMTLPVVASATLHPAPPESYTVFMAGCNFKCLHCQNWTISQYPDNQLPQRGFIAPEQLARECITQLDSISGKRISADRIFFSGGEPTIHLPYVRKVVEAARKINPHTKVNFDTNGYMTRDSLKKVLDFTTSITYDLKAYREDVHLALTGVSCGPVLRNAAYIAKYAREKLWEYRIVVIPKINEAEVKPLVAFIADIDSSLPVCFLAFRPNFCLESHPGASRYLMDRCVAIAHSSGLNNAYWAGHTDIPGKILETDTEMVGRDTSNGARRATVYAHDAGCTSQSRKCLSCVDNQTCKLKQYTPRIVT
ncbi:MAG: radical SAM protein [Desulfobacterales bacterium]|jgi:pyruvate formate lyase activating enzyme